MKLMVPAVGVVIAATGCCCCGDFFEGVKEGFDEAMREAQSGAEVTVTTEDGTTTTASTTPVAAPPSTAGGGSAPSGDLCGRFGSMNLKAPSGFSVTACSDVGGTGGLLLRGQGTPAEACAVMKGWGDSTGFSLLANASMGDTQAITYQKDGEILAMSCSVVGGETQISVGLTRM